MMLAMVMAMLVPVLVLLLPDDGQGEVSHAEFCDLDFRENVLYVQPKPHRNWKVKDKEDRFIPLPPPLMEKLREQKGG